MAAELTQRQWKFINVYMAEGNATQAAIEAGYSAKTATVQGARLLTNAHVQAEIEARTSRVAETLNITQEMVLSVLWDRATADPRELIEAELGACRHCHGLDHRYQFTPQEQRDRRAEFDVMQAKWLASARDSARLPEALRSFDDMGGIGYSPKKPPHPDCPECHGEGAPHVVLKDQRTLSRSASRLLAGVKPTAAGYQVLMHDQGKALELVGRHLGMFSDTLKVKHSGEIETGRADLREMLAKLTEEERATLKPILLRLTDQRKDAA